MKMTSLTGGQSLGSCEEPGNRQTVRVCEMAESFDDLASFGVQSSQNGPEYFKAACTTTPWPSEIMSRSDSTADFHFQVFSSNNLNTSHDNGVFVRFKASQVGYIISTPSFPLAVKN
jgi:hypothetical protein